VLSDHWYKNTELIEHVFSFVAPLAFAGLFLGLPGLADRLYRGFGFRITLCITFGTDPFPPKRKAKGKSKIRKFKSDLFLTHNVVQLTDRSSSLV